VLLREIAKTPQGLDAKSVRARVVGVCLRHGSPVLDVGTGACACMAAELAQRGLRVMAVDHASSAVRIAQERAAGGLADYLEIRHADAARLPFPDGSYRSVVAFDALCHAPDPAQVLKEMFRVSSHAVIVTELNDAGRRATRHRDLGFELRLPELLALHCNGCQKSEDAHHVSFVCEGDRVSEAPRGALEVICLSRRSPSLAVPKAVGRIDATRSVLMRPAYDPGRWDAGKEGIVRPLWTMQPEVQSAAHLERVSAHG